MTPFQKRWEQSVVYHAVADASARGADDLIHLRESYGDLIRGTALAPGTYPTGFDFRKLFTTFGGEVPLSDMVQYWAATERGAAWKSV